MRHIVKARELPHMWAHQTQDWARCGNVSFRGPYFYSYSTCIGEYVRPGLYAISERQYSVTTARHLTELARAIPGDAVVVRIQDPQSREYIWPRDRRDATREMVNSLREAEKFRQKARRARKENTRDWNELQTQLWLDNAAVLKREFKLRNKIDQNTIERFEINRRRQERRLTLAKQRKVEELKEKWLRDETPHFPYGYSGGTLLRVHNNECIETSLGIRLEFDEALRVYRIIKALRARQKWEDNASYPIAGYAVNRVTPEGVIAGCHRVSWAEIERIAEELKWTESDV